MVAMTPDDIYSFVLQKLRPLRYDNGEAKERVTQMLESITVARNFTRDRQNQKLHDAFASIELAAVEPDVLKGFINMIPLVGERAAINLQETMRAAAVILTHSHFEEVQNSLIEMWLHIWPREWQEEIFSSWITKYSLKQVVEMDFDAVMTVAAKHFWNNQKKDGIASRNDSLMRHLRQQNAVEGLLFIERETLKDFDRKRHQLVHGTLTSTPRDDLGDVVELECAKVFEHITSLMKGFAKVAEVDWDAVVDLEEVFEALEEAGGFVEPNEDESPDDTDESA